MDLLNYIQVTVMTTATVIIAIASIGSVLLTKELIKENRLLREQYSKPEIITYLKINSRNWMSIEFVLENIGSGTAKNVECSLAFDIEDFQSHDIEVEKFDSPIKVEILPPGTKLEWYFGEKFTLLNQESPLASFNTSVKYENNQNQVFGNNQIIDINILFGISVYGQNHEIQKLRALEDIATNILKIDRHGPGRFIPN